MLRHRGKVDHQAVTDLAATDDPARTQLRMVWGVVPAWRAAWLVVPISFAMAKPCSPRRWQASFMDDAEDLFQTQQRIGQPLGAIAALVAGRDYSLARQYAAGLRHDDLAELVVYLSRMYAGGLLQSFEGQGMSQEEARKMATEHFRREAAMFTLPREDDPPEA